MSGYVLPMVTAESKRSGNMESLLRSRQNGASFLLHSTEQSKSQAGPDPRGRGSTICFFSCGKGHGVDTGRGKELGPFMHRPTSQALF